MLKKLNNTNYLNESLSSIDRTKIIEYVAMGFETGHHLFSQDDYAKFRRDETEIKDKKAAWAFYWDCINMGPAGFYEEFCNEYNFSDDYKMEYGSNNDYFEESADLDGAYSKDQIELDIKQLTNNFTVKKDILKCWYESEYEHAYNLLSDHYKNIKHYKLGDWFILEFNTPID